MSELPEGIPFPGGVAWERFEDTVAPVIAKVYKLLGAEESGTPETLMSLVEVGTSSLFHLDRIGDEFSSVSPGECLTAIITLPSLVHSPAGPVLMPNLDLGLAESFIFPYFNKDDDQFRFYKAPGDSQDPYRFATAPTFLRDRWKEVFMTLNGQQSVLPLVAVFFNGEFWHSSPWLSSVARPIFLGSSATRKVPEVFSTANPDPLRLTHQGNKIPTQWISGSQPPRPKYLHQIGSPRK